MMENKKTGLNPVLAIKKLIKSYSEQSATAHYNHNYNNHECDGIENKKPLKFRCINRHPFHGRPGSGNQYYRDEHSKDVFYGPVPVIFHRIGTELNSITYEVQNEPNNRLNVRTDQ